MGKADRLMKGAIIGLIAGLILGGIIGYISHNILSRNFIGRGNFNFQIDEQTKNEITSFFESASDINEINSYCGQNRVNCAYYCRDINPNHEICKQILNFTRPIGRQWNP